MNNLQGKIKFEVLVAVLVGLAVVVGVVSVLWYDATGEKGSGLGEEFVYDIKEFAEIDPGLVLYEQAGNAIAAGFEQSQAIAVDSQGRIHIAGDNSVRVLDDNGGLARQIELEGMPRCLAVDAEGKTYVGFRDHLEVYDEKGARSARWEGLGGDARLTSIAVYKDNVFVADAGNRIVLRYDRAGEIINRIGGKDKERNIPGFVIPSPYFDLAVAKDGLLRVVNPGRHRIEAYTFDGDLEFWWGKASVKVDGFSGCCNPVNFAILEDESFVTSEKGLIRVKVYDVEGEFVGVVAGPRELAPECKARVCNLPSECQAGGFDVAVDGQGRVFVLDTINNVVRIFSRKDAD